MEDSTRRFVESLRAQRRGGYIRRVWWRLRRNRLATLSLGCVITMFVISWLA
ncbi:MAG: hypothetical protein ACE5D3_07890, partial [Candidatus Binatia bacterium]